MPGILYICDKIPLMPERDAANRRLLILMLGLLLLALFLHMGRNGLYNEEPRRALVGLEMELNDNLLVPTQMGEFYYKKPPFFNWMLLGSFRVFGYNEFAARFVTVLSFLGMGLLTFLFFRKYHSTELGILGALFFMVSADQLFSGSLFAEIDHFYSLVTYASFLAIYHFHKQNRLYALFLSVYFLGAIGTLCKGFPSPVFIVMSLGSFFLFTRQWRKLFSPAHFAGIALYLLIVGGYLFAYAQYNDPIGYLYGLGSQATDRTVVKTGVLPVITHLFTFPGELVILTAPASGLFFLAFFKGAIRKLWQNEVLRFTLVMFGANIFVYWMAPGTRSRYLYMMLPLLISLFVALYLQHRERLPVIDKFLNLFGLVLSLLLVIPVITPFLPPMAPFRDLILPGSLALGALSLLLLVYRLRARPPAMLWLAMCLILGRLWFDVIVLPVRAETADHTQWKADALRVAEITEGQPLFLWQYKHDGNISLASVFYIERERREVLRMKYELNCDDYFLGLKREIADLPVQVYHEFFYKQDHYLLVKFKDCP